MKQENRFDKKAGVLTLSVVIAVALLLYGLSSFKLESILSFAVIFMLSFLLILSGGFFVWIVYNNIKYRIPNIGNPLAVLLIFLCSLFGLLIHLGVIKP